MGDQKGGRPKSDQKGGRQKGGRRRQKGGRRSRDPRYWELLLIVINKKDPHFL